MTKFRKMLLALAAGAMSLFLPVQASAQDIEFGNDSSEFANDGECDDPRFEGDGMAVFLFEDGIMADASDCRAAFENGTITLSENPQNNAMSDLLGPGTAREAGDLEILDVSIDEIEFGDDYGQWANDGECDDWRFVGEGMTFTMLLADDVRHDASDCRSGFAAGSLFYVGDAGSVNGAENSAMPLINSSHIQWGDDNSEFARDGECDDMRFVGAGMTQTSLRSEDVMHDATDCRVAFEQGRLSLRE